MDIPNKNKLDKFSRNSALITKYGIAAKSIDIGAIPSHTKPGQVRDEIPTLNNFGFMKFEWDEFCKGFVDFSKNVQKPVLELAPAYGWVIQRALEKNIEIIAADISKEHLEVILKETPKDKLDKLYIYHGEFPTEIDFPQEALSGVLASRLLHFLTPKSIETGLKKIYNWLEDGGKFVCSNCSIYHYTVSSDMLSCYRAAEIEKDGWCGRGDFQSKNPQDPFYPFDIGLFKKVLPEYGFEIEKIKYFDYPSDIYSKNKEGHVGFVARKT